MGAGAAVADAALSGASMRRSGSQPLSHRSGGPLLAPETGQERPGRRAHIFIDGRAARSAQGLHQRYWVLSAIADVARDRFAVANIWPSIGGDSTKPRLSLTVDPAAELNGIVRLLAETLRQCRGGYEKAIRRISGATTGQLCSAGLSGGDEQAPRRRQSQRLRSPRTEDPRRKLLRCDRGDKTPASTS